MRPFILVLISARNEPFDGFGARKQRQLYYELYDVAFGLISQTEWLDIFFTKLSML